MKNKTAYLFVIIFWLIVTTAFGQIELKHFNAGWNSANDVSWFMDLSDAKTKGYTDIAKDTEAQTKYKIAVVPTIIVGTTAILYFFASSGFLPTSTTLLVLHSFKSINQLQPLTSFHSALKCFIVICPKAVLAKNTIIMINKYMIYCGQAILDSSI